MPDERFARRPQAPPFTVEHDRALALLKQHGQIKPDNAPAQRILADLEAAGFARWDGNAYIYAGTGAKQTSAGETSSAIIRFACPNCGARYKVLSASAGKKTTCRRCGLMFRVPPFPECELEQFMSDPPPVRAVPKVPPRRDGDAGSIPPASVLAGAEQLPDASEQPTRSLTMKRLLGNPLVLFGCAVALMFLHFFLFTARTTRDLEDKIITAIGAGVLGAVWWCVQWASRECGPITLWGTKKPPTHDV
jgi:hypothetical protein